MGASKIAKAMGIARASFTGHLASIDDGRHEQTSRGPTTAFGGISGEGCHR